jgi:hypothetical protein
MQRRDEMPDGKRSLARNGQGFTHDKLVPVTAVQFQ